MELKRMFGVWELFFINYFLAIMNELFLIIRILISIFQQIHQNGYRIQFVVSYKSILKKDIPLIIAFLISNLQNVVLRLHQSQFPRLDQYDFYQIQLYLNCKLTFLQFDTIKIQLKQIIRLSRQMAKRLIESTFYQITHFKRTLKQFQYKVILPPEVPAHIVRPQYVTNKLNPQFAIYDGAPGVLNQIQIQKIKKSAMVASSTLRAAQQFLIKKGLQNLQAGTDGTLTAEDIDRFVFDFIVAQGAYPTPIGFYGFPKSVCVSINECIVHGIPSMRPIQLGDKINLDVTAYLDGFHGDTNLTVIYGGPEKALTPQVRDIVPLTKRALYKALSICKPGDKFNQIGKVIQQFAKQNKIHVCEHFTGHGVGHLLHMPPMVYHVHLPTQNHVMKPGNVFTIQPVMSINQSSSGLQMWSDGMTIISQNNPNAQFQHMVLIRQDGCQILTQRQGENIPNPNGNIKNLKIY